MGLLVDGVWRDDSADSTRFRDGRFNRPTTKFRNQVTPDGSPVPNSEVGFAAEPGRYHLYVSNACPWAHRTIIFRKLKKLENVISVSNKIPFRCTFDVNAVALDTDPDVDDAANPENNTTTVDVEVFDRNDL